MMIHLSIHFIITPGIFNLNCTIFTCIVFFSSRNTPQEVFSIRSSMSCLTPWVANVPCVWWPIEKICIVYDRIALCNRKWPCLSSHKILPDEAKLKIDEAPALDVSIVPDKLYVISHSQSYLRKTLINSCHGNDEFNVKIYLDTGY